MRVEYPFRHHEWLARTVIGLGVQMSFRNGKLVSFLLSLYFLPLLFLLVLVVASLKLDIPVAVFTRDPASIGSIHPLSGVASHFGVLVLTASGAISVFSWAILRPQSYRRVSRFLLCSGLLSILLALDDLFMLHEKIYPQFFGVGEKITFLTYGLLVIGGTVKFRKTILETEYSILLVSLIFFGASLIVDGFQDNIEDVLGQWRILLEDGFKLLGIVGWFGYLLRCSLMAATQK